MKRATLAEHDGLPFRSQRLAHPCDLAWWRERGYIENDLECSCIRLTPSGRERAHECCGKCGSWRRKIDNVGECWSADRLDGDLDRGPAGRTREWEFCEAYCPQGAP